MSEDEANRWDDEGQVQWVDGYMCGIDWQHEIGEACGGTRVYMSIEDLMENHKCADQCGIVKVRVQLIKWEKPQNFKWEKKSGENLPD